MPQNSEEGERGFFFFFFCIELMSVAGGTDAVAGRLMGS